MCVVIADLRHDLRFALRSLTRAKVSVATLVASLGVGLGANAVLYTAIDGLLFRPPAGVARPSRLVRVATGQFNGATTGPSSWPDVQSLAAEAPALARVAAFDASEMALVRVGDAAQRVRVVETEPTLFDVLGGAPELGRALAEARADQRVPAVISEALWAAFDRPSDITGRALQVGDRNYVVAGVGPAGFRGLELARPSDVWIPLDPTRRLARGDRRLSAIARLADGADLETAQRQAATAAGRLAAEHPDTNRGTRSDPHAPRGFALQPFSRIDPESGAPVRLLATVALGATVLLLVSACANAASAMATRSAARRREVAVKAALGARRSRLVRQAVLEGWLLAACGGAAGLLLAFYAARLLPAWLSPEDAALLPHTVEPWIAAALLAFAIGAGALFAIGPARHAISARDIDALRAGSGQLSLHTGGSAARRLVVAGQVALSTTILIGAGVLVRAMSTALEGEGAPSAHHLAIARVSLPPMGVVDGAAVDPRARARDAVLERSGVSAAGWVATLPLRPSGSERFEAEAPAGLVESIDADVNVASGDYFAAIGMTLLEGRTFDESDRPRSPPVVIVNDVLARRYFGDHALGEYLREPDGRRLRIVGIVRSVRFRAFEPLPGPTVYFPPLQREAVDMHLIVTTAGPVEPMLGALERRLRASTPGAQVRSLRTFVDHLAQALNVDRVLTATVAACGLLALVLAAVGVHGVSADAVQRRTGEIGLRVALGAKPGAVVALIVRDALLLTGGGVLAGIGAALAIAAAGRTAVHALPWPDAITLAVVPGALLVVALGAVALPAWRALRISPTVALRVE
jgi:putative ABC transport system permease protein